jgi:hypothetical protein
VSDRLPRAILALATAGVTMWLLRPDTRSADATDAAPPPPAEPPAAIEIARIELPEPDPPAAEEPAEEPPVAVAPEQSVAALAGEAEPEPELVEAAPELPEPEPEVAEAAPEAAEPELPSEAAEPELPSEAAEPELRGEIAEPTPPEPMPAPEPEPQIAAVEPTPKRRPEPEPRPLPAREPEPRPAPVERPEKIERPEVVERPEPERPRRDVAAERAREETAPAPQLVPLTASSMARGRELLGSGRYPRFRAYTDRIGFERYRDAILALGGAFYIYDARTRERVAKLDPRSLEVLPLLQRGVPESLSPFPRDVTGKLPPLPKAAREQVGTGKRVILLFPSAVDAALVGGLHEALRRERIDPESLTSADLHYELADGRLVADVFSVSLRGRGERAVSARIALSGRLPALARLERSVAATR